MIDKEIIKELRSAGLTLQKIADIYGVTRQYIHQVTVGIKVVRTRIHKYPGNRLSPKEYARKYLLKIDGKYIKVNKRPRPDNICELCGNTVKKLDYHHWDSNHPELGMWICLSCHRFVARIEKGFHSKYSQLKSSISSS